MLRCVDEHDVTVNGMRVSVAPWGVASSASAEWKFKGTHTGKGGGGRK